jgi:hypothetical protein
MPNYPVTASADDGYTGTINDTAGTAISAAWTYGPDTHLTGFANIDTSAIGTDTISAATLWFWHVGYTLTSPAPTRQRRIKVGGTTILDTTVAAGAAGWKSEVLTAGEFALINKTGVTNVLFEVDDPAAGGRNWQVQAWDYGDHSRAPYLAVTHAAAGGPTKFSILR